MVRMLRNSWGLSEFVEDPALTERFVELVFGGVRRSGAKPLTLLLKGTNFQIKTWEALLRIPEGVMVSYQDVARHIGKPRASRAVGNAVGANPVAYLVPCHRVIKGSGFFGNYGGGRIRKRLMLGREAVEARLEPRRT
jgi:AraC family transcriptional regulator of adaptative response/methylated-DNA-[protein]-cysteine methyltransferase